MAPAKSMDPKDLLNGAVLQCVEAATLGMPFEVWKTRMGRFTNETTGQAFVNVYKRAGIAGFWQGVGPKMVESASKGAVLLFAKEGLINAMTPMNMGPTLTGVIAGAGAGVAQTSVMGPCTFIVTAVVTGSGDVNVANKIKTTWAEKGVKGFYPGATAIAARQASNWASRQGFTEFVRHRMKLALHGDENARLTVGQEAASGTVGGALATWNQPFEVARIQMQAAANEGKPKMSMMATISTISKEQGPAGLFKGIVPRVLLGVWQTLFMVTGAKLLKQYMA
mmetsp:Transcript_21479/g.47167  ORF Transcript_21479/g.47167 Transcript_21479/m.47167 type:complete len:281 (-) Transcript_21479:312-1154(-)